MRSQVAKDNEGNLDPAVPQDTVEVHASFSDEDGFFGLTSYLGYAERQLKLSNEWVALAQKTQGVQHEFPWRFVDQSHLETVGFLPKQFEFTIDQERVLDLLTGHTLYNDPSVCIRELVQNSIDAVRLQHFDQDRTRAREEGEIEIRWNSDSRELTVKDNGTGMSQEIIENHLLRVGASRYQDPKFKEDNPDFSPISRFGIGVLSAFMLADDVEITTRYASEDVARRLLLRSVHGKYLIRILDPATDPVAAEVTPHGTLFRLFVRPSAVVQDVKSITERWIMFPDSKASLFIDGEEPVCIGHKSPKFALENSFKQLLQMDDSHKTTLATEKVRFVERELDGVSVAYALIWSETFGVWSFVDSAVLNVRDNDNVKDFWRHV